MKYIWLIVLGVFVLLAAASGVAKILQMPQEVDFFGKYGLSGWKLSTFGAVQVIAGVTLVWSKIRWLSAIVVSITFVISAILLFLDGNNGLGVITTVLAVVLIVVERWDAQNAPSKS